MVLYYLVFFAMLLSFRLHVVFDPIECVNQLVFDIIDTYLLTYTGLTSVLEFNYLIL